MAPSLNSSSGPISSRRKADCVWREGEWALGGEPSIDLGIEADTEGTLQCDLSIRGARTDDNQIELWPTVETLAVRLEKSISYAEDGKPVSLQALDFSSGDGGELAKSVEVQIADTVAGALTKLTSQGTASKVAVNTALDLIAGISLDRLELTLAAPVETAFPGVRLQVEAGRIEVRDLIASFSQQEVSAAIDVDFTLGAGTEAVHDDARLGLDRAELTLAMAVEHRDGQWTAVPTSTSDRSVLKIKQGQIAVRNATISLSETELGLAGLSLGEQGLNLGFEGGLRLGAGQVYVGPTQLSFASGTIEDFTVNVEGETTSQPAVDFRSLLFESVVVTVAAEEGQRLEVQADRLSMASRTADDAPFSVQMVDSQLQFRQSEDGRGLTANAADLVLNIEAPGAVGLGALAPVDGARLSAKWDVITIGDGADAVVLGPTGLEFRINSTEPLDVDVTIHTSKGELVGRNEVLGGATIRAGITSEGVAALTLELPFATNQGSSTCRAARGDGIRAIGCETER